MMTPAAFRKIIYSYYASSGRTLPWRKTRDPYRILVSEVMLQQTQVDRVTKKYEAFLKLFPSVRSLAAASLRDVLRAWNGLGYNRRAKHLHDAARRVVFNHSGRVPKTLHDLDALPGIGKDTAGAILAYAYNKPAVFIETNVRTVFIHHFFPHARAVGDEKIIPLVRKTLDMKQPRRFYTALMDYGAHIKKTIGNHSRRSKNYMRQTPFQGSVREVRGYIMRALVSGKKLDAKSVSRKFGLFRARAAIEGLFRDNLIVVSHSGIKSA